MYFDIETDGLQHSKIHVACGSPDVVARDAQSWALAAEDAKEFIGHNIINFDLPAMEKHWGWKPRDDQKIYDTLVMSRLADPERKLHNLDDWGVELGYPKVQHEDWSTYTPEMLHRCRTDVELTERVHKAVLKKLEGIKWEDAYCREARVASIIDRQIRRGWLLDEKLCWEHIGTLQEMKMELEERVHCTIKPLPTFVKEVTPKVKQDGTFSKVGLTGPYGDDWEMVGGPFSHIVYEPFNLGSRPQVGRYLVHWGWKPWKFTETGKPVVDENTLEDCDIEEAADIKQYFTVTKRLSQMKSWVDALQDDGRVHGYVNPIGCVTSRMSHSGPNMAQIPSVGRGKFYGKECRECWIVPPGFKLVGMDAEQLELCMLAHYMKDPALIEALETGDKDKGTDVHTLNMKAAGLSTRDDAKTFIYAFLYGAGGEKLGKIVGGGKAEGDRLKAKFLRAYPALDNLIDQVKRAARRGYLVGLDGRKVPVRSQHAALNTLLQSAGAIVMKEALVVLDEFATKWNLNYEFIGNIHDEVQAEVIESDAEKFAMLAAASMERAGINLGLRVKLKGQGQIGDNWSETH